MLMAIGFALLIFGFTISGMMFLDVSLKKGILFSIIVSLSWLILMWKFILVH